MRYLQRMLTFLLTSVIAILQQTKFALENWLRAIKWHDRHLAANGRQQLEQPDIRTENPVECLQAIIDGFKDEMMIIGSDYRVRQVNNAVLQRLGTPAANVVGQPCFRVSHGAEEPCRPPWCECPLDRVFETGQSIHVVHNHWEGEVAGEASERWLEIVASPIWDNQGRVTEVIELLRDVSQSKKLQKEVLRANRELLALNSITRALSQSLDLRATLQAVAETVLDALEVKASWVNLLDDTSKLSAWASRRLPVETMDELIEAASNLGSGEQAVTSASYLVVPSDNTDGSDHTLWQFAVTPLKSNGVILGTAGVATVKRPLDQQRIQLLDAIGNQIAVAVERCKLYEELQLARDLRGELLHKVITAQEEERRRIARELHDETGQALTALRLSLERLALAPVPSAEETKARLTQASELCQQAEEEVDKLIFDLRPALLDDLGLVEAIEFYAQTRLNTAGIGLNLRVTGKERRLSGEKEAALFRVMQEGITNIVKHAHAKRATIHLQFKTDQLVAQIKDDGCGFEASQIGSSRNPKRGLGLLGMRERMNLIGGSLSIVSKPEGGTQLKAAVPLDEEGVPK